ncbi:diacylglycerol/lipid kinase family protein [Palleronia sp. LCG004]|uniref:diacylglycerol/lipid kinase family protein n=1 Tax=Palleronia sp. LCG004 TaxID=3079304 RepID=UPI002943D2E2|nr:diacylglycerol kinase family protein [Palleronia sp. LCG004]WOI56421.1 diacylglycerol kinase family protein [Palleronia sp. LCG004]
MTRSICVIANRKSGRNSRDNKVIEDAIDVFGEGTTRRDWSPENDLSSLIDKAIQDGADLIVAAGGDGTIMAVADAMRGRDVPMAVLPLGTFNFFARGLGLSEEPVEAARQILEGHAHDIRVGEVNGQTFLNNSSLGIYPSILKEREAVYSRWGRRRLAAHWSVVKTMMRFRKPMRLRLEVDGGEPVEHRTAMIFVARSAYQLDYFGLEGSELISEDKFAVLVSKANSRRRLFQLAWRLASGTVREGRDYELLSARDLVATPRRRSTILAFDGEKQRAPGPFRFRMADAPLKIILPAERTE